MGLLDRIYNSSFRSQPINTSGSQGANGSSEVKQKFYHTQPTDDNYRGVKNEHRPTFGKVDRTTTNGDPRLKNDLHTFMILA